MVCVSLWMEPWSGCQLTLFHGVFFLEDWLNFLNLLSEKIYFAFEEGLRVLHFLQKNKILEHYQFYLLYFLIIDYS